MLVHASSLSRSDMPSTRLPSTLVRVLCRILHPSLPGHAGTIGHVAHGKSTVVKAISGVMTVRFKNELVRNITIKLGYANAKVCCEAFGTRFDLAEACASLRSTSARTQPAHVLDATGRIDPTKKITLRVSGQDVATK